MELEFHAPSPPSVAHKLLVLVILQHEYDIIIVITHDKYDILVITESEAKPRMSVNNKDIIQMYLGYNWLITQKTLPISASFCDQ